MKSNRKKMISDLVREGRVAKGYTQKELSELSSISVRSIQRIENGEILPRSYTLKTLAGVLGFSIEKLRQESEPRWLGKLNFSQKLILSTGVTLILLLAVMAFIAQSANFPETNFELITLLAAVLVLITLAMSFIWKSRE
jgi:transcriptional regulator with XRE-family HTH domain